MPDPIKKLDPIILLENSHNSMAESKHRINVILGPKIRLIIKSKSGVDVKSLTKLGCNSSIQVKVHI